MAIRLLKTSRFFKRKSAFTELAKTRLSVMNSSMTLYGYIAATTVTATTFSPPIALGIFTGNTLMAISSQIMGQTIEVEEDSKMERTKNRPLVTKEISKTQSTIMGISFYTTSNLIQVMCGVGMAPILLSNLTLGGYLVYIVLKKQTRHNTVFGAVVGTMPILIGMSQCVGVTALPPVLAMMVFYLFNWQFIHFYSILSMFRKQYDNTNFVMENHKNVIRNMTAFSVLMAGCCFGVFVSDGNMFFTGVGIVTSAFHLWVIKLIKEMEVSPCYKTTKNVKMFSYLLFLTFFGSSMVALVYRRIFSQKQRKKEIEEEKA